MSTQTHNRPDFGIPLGRHAAPQSVKGQGHRFLITHHHIAAASALKCSAIGLGFPVAEKRHLVRAKVCDPTGYIY